MTTQPDPLANPQRSRNSMTATATSIFRNVLDADLIREASDHIDWLLARHPELRPEQLWHTLVPRDPFWVRLISDDRLLDIAEHVRRAEHRACSPRTTSASRRSTASRCSGTRTAATGRWSRWKW